MQRIKVAPRHAGALLLVLVQLLQSSYSVGLCHAKQTTERAARKFHEYRVKDLRSHDEQMLLWSAYDEFTKEPESSRLYIIGYSNLPGGARRYAARARNYLVADHGVSPARIVALDGGRRAEASVEIWFVPAGAQEPLPRPSGTFEGNEHRALKYDEFPLVGWWLIYGKRYEGEAGRLDGFASALQSSPKAKSYLVVYKGAQDCEYCLSPGTELTFAKEQKDYLVRKHQIAPSRIYLVSGGRRRGGALELWIVPSGARFPRVGHGSRSKR